MLLALQLNMLLEGDGGGMLDPPVLIGTVPDFTFTVNVAISSTDLSTYFSGATSYSLSATPSGLSFNTSTGVLTGTPDTVGSSTGLIITATNADGDTDSNSFSIFVADDTEFASGQGRKRDARRRGFFRIWRG